MRNIEKIHLEPSLQIPPNIIYLYMKRILDGHVKAILMFIYEYEKHGTTIIFFYSSNLSSLSTVILQEISCKEKLRLY